MNCRKILRECLIALRRIVLVITAIVLGLWLFLAQPSCRSARSVSTPLPVDPERMQTVIRVLSEDFFPRSFLQTENLAAAARYIEDHFREAGGRIFVQEYVVQEAVYQNICVRFGPAEGPRTVIGAHYDSFSTTPGADDNASGIAGLVELAYLFGANPPTETVELVAYTLEEPPHFTSKYMGSHQHAAMLHEEGVTLQGMIALEMIGYYSDRYGSQKYPATVFHLIYPNTGNFIAVIGKLDQRRYTAAVKRGMKGAGDIDIYSVSAPRKIQGVDFSDHRSYWDFGYPAVMITDTAFYRNHTYHTKDDTWDRLNYDKMAEVVKAVYNATLTLSADAETR